MIHGHGNNLLAYNTAIKLDFSSNIAFNNHCVSLCDFLQTRLHSINNYPDPGATHLTQKLAHHHGLAPETVLVTNGSAEAFYLVAHLLAQANTAICVPAFAEYEDACSLHQHTLHFIDLHTFSQRDCSSYDSVWLANPNNPDGLVTPPEVILSHCRRFPHTTFIIDQAYVQLSGIDDVDILPHVLRGNIHLNNASSCTFGENRVNNREDAAPTAKASETAFKGRTENASKGAPPPTLPQNLSGNLPEKMPENLPDNVSRNLPKCLPDNLIVIHSLTKEFGIPGLRLGYITASAKRIAKLSTMRPPWSVNTLALTAGEYILDNYAALLPDKNELLRESRFLQEALATIPHVTVLPSSCNFFLSHLSQGTAAALKQRLIDTYGILIRDASNFKGLQAGHFRVAPQNRENNLALIKALREILESSFCDVSFRA